MDKQNMERIIEEVTRQVLSAMDVQNECQEKDGTPRILLLAKPGTKVPENLTRGARLFDLMDFETNQNILRYDRVVIGNLNVTQLADIALGRVGDNISRAVSCALLSGVEVVVTESAFEHRYFAGRASAALYNVLEGYVRTIQVYGVRLVTEKQEPKMLDAKLTCHKADAADAQKEVARPVVRRLITEADAMTMLKADGSVSIPKGVILTPSARDVFSHARVELVYDS